jgi:hypothetical protein
MMEIFEAYATLSVELPKDVAYSIHAVAWNHRHANLVRLEFSVTMHHPKFRHEIENGETIDCKRISSRDLADAVRSAIVFNNVTDESGLPDDAFVEHPI